MLRVEGLRFRVSGFRARVRGITYPGLGRLRVLGMLRV